MKLYQLKAAGLLALVTTICCSCQAVKPYQAELHQDHYMQQNTLSIEKLEAEAESFREGASGGGGGKTGGGCGCN